MNGEPLAISLWSMTATTDLAANHACLVRGIRAAQAAGARVLLTPECALTGYAPALGRTCIERDWCAVGDAEDDLLTLARQAGITLVLGTCGPVPGGIANEAVAGPDPQPVRYRKRHLTPADLPFFVPGDRSAWIDAHGWRLGLAICYDVRFDDVWADLAQAGCDAFLCIAHMAGPDPDPGVKAAVVPQVITTRAMGWATPLAFCSTTAPDNWVGSGFWDARGVCTQQTNAPGEHLLTGCLLPRSSHDPWYTGLRDAALASRSQAQRGS